VRPSKEIIAGNSLCGFKRKLDRRLRDARGFLEAKFSFIPRIWWSAKLYKMVLLTYAVSD